MFDKLRAIALTALISLGGIAGVPAAAQADGLYLNLGGHNDARVGVYVGDRHAPRWDRHAPRWDRHDSRWDRQRAVCTPQRALHKAKRMGLHRTEVRRVTRNTITVSGRDRGHRQVVTFGRGRHCPILRY